MKVLITFLTYGEDVFGGVERSLFNLCRGLSLSGAKVVIFTSSEFMGGGIHDEVVVITSNHLRGRFDAPMGPDFDIALMEHYRCSKLEVENELRIILRRESPDYVLVVDQLWGILPFLDVWECITCPVGLWVHMPHNPDFMSIIGSMPIVDYWCVTPEIRFFVADAGGVPFDRIHILPNSIPLSDYKQCQTQRTPGRVFSNARISPEKGTLLLLDAFALVKSRMPSARLDLCGGGFHFGFDASYFDEVNRKIESEACLKNSVRILGVLRWNEVRQHLGAASVAVIASNIESFPMSALEAMASGTPLVSTCVGNLDRLASQCARLVPPQDINALADALLEVLRCPEQSIEMGRAGQARVASYDSVEVASDFIKMAGRNR